MIIKALITNKNNPKEKTVMGKVNMMINGLIKIFNKLNTIATKKEVVILATNTPGSSCAMIKTKMVVTMIFNKSFIFSLIKRKYILDKKRLDFRHEASVLPMVWLLKWHLENGVLRYANLHL